jgi:SAM-dependent methyltransferase
MLNRRDKWWRARGLDRLDGSFSEPSVVGILDARLGAGHPVRMLEIGCGEGHALMALAWRYRNAPVHLVGINHAPSDTMAGPADLRRACVDFEICTREQAERLRLPELVFVDAGKGLPFAAGAFDLIGSSLTFHYIVDKARALTEAWRVLARDGTALIHLDSFDPDGPDFMNTSGDGHLFTPRFVIYDPQRNRLSTAAYLARLARSGFDIRLECSPGRPQHTVVRLNRRTNQEMELGLRLDVASTLPQMQSHFSFKQAVIGKVWWGTRSVYFAETVG